MNCLNRFFFSIVCVFLCACVCVHTSAHNEYRCLWRWKVSDPLHLEPQITVSCLIRGLGTKLRSSRRTAGALKNPASSPAHKKHFKHFVCDLPLFFYLLNLVQILKNLFPNMPNVALFLQWPLECFIQGVPFTTPHIFSSKGHSPWSTQATRLPSFLTHTWKVIFAHLCDPCFSSPALTPSLNVSSLRAGVPWILFTACYKHLVFILQSCQWLSIENK